MATAPVDVHRHDWTRFARHFGAMAIAMVAGMAAYAALLAVVAPGARLDHPEWFALGMAAAMSAPMVAWMHRHGHPARLSAEMTAAMFVPYLVAIACYRGGAVEAEAVCPIGCGAMFAAMLAAMLYRRDDYS